MKNKFGAVDVGDWLYRS